MLYFTAVDVYGCSIYFIYCLGSLIYSSASYSVFAATQTAAKNHISLKNVKLSKKEFSEPIKEHLILQFITKTDIQSHQI